MNWISVKDRLPKVGVSVPVLLDGVHFNIAFLDKNKIFRPVTMVARYNLDMYSGKIDLKESIHDVFNFDVTHWAEIVPPNEEE